MRLVLLSCHCGSIGINSCMILLNVIQICLCLMEWWSSVRITVYLERYFDTTANQTNKYLVLVIKIVPDLLQCKYRLVKTVNSILVNI